MIKFILNNGRGQYKNYPYLYVDYDSADLDLA